MSEAKKSSRSAASSLEKMQRAASRGGSQTQDQGMLFPENIGKKQTVRVTVDLPKERHRFLRIFAAESDCDGMSVMRALLDELAGDEELAGRVKERLTGGE